MKPKKATTITCRTRLLLKCINQQFARCFFSLLLFQQLAGLVWQHNVGGVGKCCCNKAIQGDEIIDEKSVTGVGLQ